MGNKIARINPKSTSVTDRVNLNPLQLTPEDKFNFLLQNGVLGYSSDLDDGYEEFKDYTPEQFARMREAMGDDGKQWDITDVTAFPTVDPSKLNYENVVTLDDLNMSENTKDNTQNGNTIDTNPKVNTKDMLLNMAGKSAEYLSFGYSSPYGNALNGIGDVAMAFNPLIGGIIKGAGVATNLLFGNKMNQQNISKVENNIAKMNNFNSSASDTMGLLAEAKNAPSAMNFNQSFIGKDGAFSNAVKNKYNSLKTLNNAGANRVSRSLQANANNISFNKLTGLERGQIFDFGGQLNSNGTIFDSPLFEVNAGGTHETNPNGGVPVRIDPQTGEPQLVEEGEAIYDQFVFSNNPNLPLFDDTKKGLNLSRKAKTYADAAKEINADVSEMPNDMLARKTAAIRLSALAQTQEQIKQALEAEQQQEQQAQMQAQMQAEQEEMSYLEGI
jgi:hypothetical protein